MRHMSIAVVAMALAACDVDPTSSRGFRMPDGSADLGRTVFIETGCVSCHIVSNDEGVRGDDIEAQMTVELGGGRARVASYGELVTAIINPSHTIARSGRGEVGPDGVSPMTNYNDEMTVTDLTHLVAYVQSFYWELPND